jgi:hypothetical protein
MWQHCALQYVSDRNRCGDDIAMCHIAADIVPDIVATGVIRPGCSAISMQRQLL